MLMLCLGAILFGPHSVEATEMFFAQPVTVVITSSDDFPEMTFVLYESKTRHEGWPLQLDLAAAKIVQANEHFTGKPGEYFSVLAVPRAVAEKTNGGPDPAWFESSAPDVVRDLGDIAIPYLPREFVLRYQLYKTDDGAELVLLNKKELAAAKNYAPPAIDRSSQSDSPAPWVLFAGGGLLLICGVLLGFLILKRRNSKERNLYQEKKKTNKPYKTEKGGQDWIKAPF